MQTISLEDLDRNKTYSYADYLGWQFEQFVELLRGRLFPMAAPNRAHQKISMKLSYGLFLATKDSGCEVYAAPFDVRLVKNPEGKTDKEIYNVVQPDLCVICDPTKLDKRGCLGAPDLIVEIISNKNAKHDVVHKFNLYEENGVREYWLVRPSERTVQRFVLREGRYVSEGYFAEGDSISSFVLPDLNIDLNEVFEGLEDMD
ncbi:MAG: Uma2 family endonuclease [Bernardetiaceae bacterium]|nr:Uma2 family endonuclease [Bernardetiaceae bacterium]